MVPLLLSVVPVPVVLVELVVLVVLVVVVVGVPRGVFGGRKVFVSVGSMTLVMILSSTIYS